jgi:multidrug efflux system outer membrane protein
VISSVATTYFQALELRDRIRSGAAESRERPKDSQRLQARTDGRHRHRTRRRAAGDHGRAAERRDSAALLQQFRQTVYALAVLIGKTPESVDVDMGTLTSCEPPVGRRRFALAAAVAPAGCGRSGTAADRRQRGHHRCARGLFPSIELTASGGYESRRWPRSSVRPTASMPSAPGLTQPIFHGGALRGQWPTARRATPNC